jgi:hypothetical protein
MAHNDLLGDTTVPPRRLPPIELQRTSNNIPQYPVTVEIPMQEIRRQNDVDRWRNKLRLQERFEVNYNSILLKKQTILFHYSNVMLIH